MGILDEAIKEHLELKRQHGAADDELQKLEDEAFGPAERPGAEAPGDAQSEAPTEFMAVPGAGEEPQQRQEPSVADLQEAPPAPEPSEDAEEPEPSEDREAIAEQPTQHFDVEEELAAESPPAPSDEELVEEGMEEPRLAPVDPLANIEAVEEIEVEAAPATELEEEDEEDEFWSDQRLSEELDQALDAPLRDEDGPSAEESSAEPAAEEQPASEPPSAPGSAEHDVLEDTPDFLEDAPEDDDLWFEQKPPKDFDFDD